MNPIEKFSFVKLFSEIQPKREAYPVAAQSFEQFVRLSGQGSSNEFTAQLYRREVAESLILEREGDGGKMKPAENTRFYGISYLTATQDGQIIQYDAEYDSFKGTANRNNVFEIADYEAEVQARLIRTIAEQRKTIEEVCPNASMRIQNGHLPALTEEESKTAQESTIKRDIEPYSATLAKKILVDFDGVIFGDRPPMQAIFFTHWLNPLAKYPKRFNPKTQVPLEHKAPSIEISKKQAKEVDVHKDRKVKTGMRQFLESLIDEIEGNTGRSNTEAMAQATLERLREAGVDRLLGDIHYKPEGLGSDEGKFWVFVAIKLLGGTFRHFDDNAAFVREMAQIFTEDEFVVVEDLTTPALLSPEIQRNLPNVQRITIDKKGNARVVRDFSRQKLPLRRFP